MASPDPSPNGDPALPESFEMYLEPVDPSELNIEPIPTVEAVTDLPRPGFEFWRALLWCVLLLALTQIVPAIVLLGGLFVMNGSELVKRANTVEEVFKQAEVQRVLQTATIVGPVCGILFSLFYLPRIAGRNWPRRLSIRL